MPLNTSGPISIGGSTAGQSINLEFGRAAGAQTSMSQLYRGGGIVPDAAGNAAVPLSGVISLSQLRGAVNRVSVTVNITANQTNYVFNTAKVPGYVAGLTDVIFNIASGVVLSANSTGVFGGDVDTSWAAGDTIRINNNGGFILGMGGAGGRGGAGDSAVNPGTVVEGTAGSTGGPAFRAQRAVSINNGGTIGGGGGGGGGGESAATATKTERETIGGGGGGGGRSGATNSAAGVGGTALLSWAINTPGNSGSAGTFSSAGAGGAGRNLVLQPGAGAGGGGNGGGWGAAGASGAINTTGTGPINPGPYVGGAAGAAVSGNSNITWVATGTRLGAIA